MNSHLFFADDSIFFIEAGLDEARALKQILSQYEMISGQRINYEKSEICFSRNSPADARVDICRELGVTQVSCHSKYLGLPLVVGQRKSESFKCIVEKVWRKVTDWKAKLLSAAGREVLVKTVLQAMPVYMMSVYQFPKKVLSELVKLIQQFWWQKDGKKGVSWLHQDLLQQRKWEGGLGFKNLELFNKAILMRIVWRMVTNPQLLMSKILSAKYCSNASIFHARLGSRPSHVWRGIMKSIGIFLGGIWWDVERSTYRWKYTSNGVFSVRSAYEVIKTTIANSGSVGEQSDKGKLQKFWKKIWSCNIPNKLKVLCWRFYHNSLPDANNLRKRGIDLADHCRLCGFRVEIALHVMRDCWWAQAIIQKFGVHIPSALQMVNLSADWLWNLAMLLTEEDFRSLLVVIWLCWKNRNRVWHGEDCWSVEKAVINGKCFLRSPCSWFAPHPPLSIDLSGKWMPPVEGTTKINTDGSWCGLTRSAGVGIVARDHRGVIEWSWAEFSKGCFCSSEVEGKALLLGMELASRMRINNVIFEVDSLEVYKAISIGIGIEEWCISWLHSALRLLGHNPGWRICFANRESNMVADKLAYMASMHCWEWRCLDAIPFCLGDVVCLCSAS